MADRKYDEWNNKRIEEEILKVRLDDLVLQKELCFTLNEKAKLENDRYALAFSYTYLADCYLAMRKNSKCILYLNRAKALSEAMQYEKLLITIYNLYGMFCNSIYDEVTAMEYYLKTLDIAEKQQDYIHMASAYNNIATLFDIKHNYTQAIFYYKKCYETAAASGDDTAYSRAVALTNLSCCAYKLKLHGELQEKLQLFSSIEQIKQSKALQLLQLYVISMYQHLCEDYQSFYQTMDTIMEVQMQVDNKLLVHQVLINICEQLLDIQDQSYTKQFLQILDEINRNNDIKSKKELQKVVVRYCEEFESEETKLKAYRDFFHIIVSIEDLDMESYSAGLAAKMELHHTKAKQDDLEKENEHLEKLMNIDDLTEIGNRRCMDHDLGSEEFYQAEMAAVAMLDIDYFKQYNDIYGHQKGDKALIEVGRSLSKASSDQAGVYRYGGDEFAMIFLNLSEEEVRKSLEFVREDIIHKKIRHQGSMTGEYVTISYGYAWTAQKGLCRNDLLKQADAALYEVKKKRPKP